MYLDIQLTVFIKLSSEIPFLYINNTADTTPVDMITSFSFKQYMISYANFFEIESIPNPCCLTNNSSSLYFFM